MLTMCEQEYDYLISGRHLGVKCVHGVQGCSTSESIFYERRCDRTMTKSADRENRAVMRRRRLARPPVSMAPYRAFMR